jgi:NTE family protein
MSEPGAGLALLEALGGAGAALTTDAEQVVLDEGDVLFRAGDQGDAVYVVQSGRLQILAPGERRILGVCGPGQPVGEIAMFTGQPRSATVRALRRTRLLRIPAARFERLLAEQPQLLHPLCQHFAQRLLSGAEGGHAPPPSVIVLDKETSIPAADLRAFAERLAKDLAAELVGAGELDEALRSAGAEPRVGLWLAGRESAGRILLIALDGTERPWTAECRRIADRLLLLAQPPTTGGTLAATGPSAAAELVFLHPEGAALPSHTGARLQGAEAHHHLRGPGDGARLARHLSGRTVGVVLSGGGACAFAHIGALRAFAEAKIPIDRVGGASFGGIMAAQVAAGWDAPRMLEVNREVWNRVRIDRDFHLPRSSLLASGRQLRALDAMFGDTQIEDLWIPFFCVTANLSRGTLVVHRKGPVARWVHAGASPPALQPPVPDAEGDLHIDGGVLENLPVGPMREAGAGPILAVNVSPFREMRAGSTALVKRSWWNFWRPRPKPQLPGLVSILYRTAKLTSLNADAANARLADLVIEPTVEPWGLTDYRAIDALERAGYEAAARALERDPGRWEKRS